MLVSLKSDPDLSLYPTFIRNTRKWGVLTFMTYCTPVYDNLNETISAKASIASTLLKQVIPWPKKTRFTNALNQLGI